MPTLYLIAGPDGAGKSTYFDWAIHEQIIPAIQQVNGDVLYKNNPALT
jgi:predicted ABC-type ATPase